MIEEFWSELYEGEIIARDHMQFELKSEFIIHPHIKDNSYKQEIYLFIPSSLQINPETYPKIFFYLDETNLIRYKTPRITLQELTDRNYTLSPLAQLQKIVQDPKASFSFSTASDELKLFVAIFRSRIREEAHRLIKELDSNEREKIKNEIDSFCKKISDSTHAFRKLSEKIEKEPNFSQLIRHFRYADEFTSNAIEECLVMLLKHHDSLESVSPQSHNIITQLIINEKLYRKRKNLGPKSSKAAQHASETVLYRQGLLNRFVLETLSLGHVRLASEEKHRHVIGAIAAGVAMTVYLALLAWKASTLVINSISFFFFAAFFYVIKDRIKEGFKTLYSKRAHHWFPDYSTEITNSSKIKVGKLTENFTFMEIGQLPKPILKIRNHRFHEELQALHRHETIIQYKREVTLNPAVLKKEERRRGVTIIFRFNIHRFLQKASNPLQTHMAFDTYTHEISEKLLPKVYHLNLIIRNSWMQEDMNPKIEIKAYRVVVDKNGIKRVEHIA